MFKLNKIIILTFLFISIVMISAVSASENIDLNESDDENCLKESFVEEIVESNDDEDIGNKFDISVKDESIIDQVRIQVNMPKDAKNNLTVDVDEKNIRNISSKEVIDSNGYFMFDLSNFNIGSHNMTFNYSGMDYKFFKSTTINLTLFQAYIPTSIMVNDESDEMGPSILADGIYGLEGNITVYIDNKKMAVYPYYEYDTEGYYLGRLPFGDHVIEVRFTNGSYNYSKKVNGHVWYGFPVYDYLYYDKESYISISLPYDLGKGKLTVKIDGKNYKYTRNDFELKIVNPKLSMGIHNLTIIYSGDKKYYPTEYSENVSVNGVIEMPDSYLYATAIDEISCKLPKDAKGNLCINITRSNGDHYVLNKIKFVNGKATFSFDKLPLNDELSFYCYYDGDDYDVIWNFDSYTIVEPKFAYAKDVSMTYYDGTNFKVRLTDSNGNGLGFIKVSFKIDGKLVKNIETDYEGWAIYKITQIPKKYKITVEYGGIKVTKKLTVKHILSIKKVNVRKNAKKLVLTASLKKVKGKYLKGKKITFKFNGKKFNAKTNKKGIAKVTIKKKTLKKLKVGKKVKYQATFIKDTVKRTAKIKK